ncbi:MAG: rod-binding protein [Candidatus Hydrogenedentota bacterium]
MTADRAREQQLENLRNSAPEFGQKVIRSIDKSRKLFESASTPQEVKMKETASEFVSILFGMMFKEMDKAVQRTGFLDGGTTEETFRSMVLDDYAKNAANQGANPMTHRIYEMLYDANSRRADFPEDGGPALNIPAA